MTLNNRIKMIENNQTQAIIELKKTQENQKQVEYMKSELKNMLLCELMELDNLYNLDTKAEAIEKVINNTTTLLYNKNFTRQFLNEKYYQVARQVEQIKKKTEATNKPDYRQRIAIEKWDLQRQKELLKIEKLKQDINKNNIKYNIKQPQQRTTTKNCIQKRKRFRSCKSITIFNVCTCCNIRAYNIRIHKCSSKKQIKRG